MPALPFIVALAAALGLFVFSRTDTGRGLVASGVDALARGLRNNNPGNIRHSGDRWLGMREVQTDAAFVQFTEPKFGVRALGRVLLSYERAGKRTVRAIITRWAPNNENNTAAYVAAVARALSVDADQVLDVREYLPRLAAAIIQHENGKQPFSLSDLKAWVYLS